MSAGDLALGDSHEVPFWEREERFAGRIHHRPVSDTDSANLYTWLDWMLSASSNAAANVVLRETLLLTYFQSSYPPSNQQIQEFMDLSLFNFPHDGKKYHYFWKTCCVKD